MINMLGHLNFYHYLCSGDELQACSSGTNLLLIIDMLKKC